MTAFSSKRTNVRIVFKSPAIGVGTYNDGSTGNPPTRHFEVAQEYEAIRLNFEGVIDPVYIITIGNVDYTVAPAAVSEMLADSGLSTAQDEGSYTTASPSIGMPSGYKLKMWAMSPWFWVLLLGGVWLIGKFIFKVKWL